MPVYNFRGSITFFVESIAIKGKDEEDAKQKIIGNPTSCVLDSECVQVDIECIED